jgi:hypothetical protein
MMLVLVVVGGGGETSRPMFWFLQMTSCINSEPVEKLGVGVPHQFRLSVCPYPADPATNACELSRVEIFLRNDLFKK